MRMCLSLSDDLSVLKSYGVKEKEEEKIILKCIFNSQKV